MWSYFLLLQTSLHAALSTDWSPSRRQAGMPANRLWQWSSREVTKVATAAFTGPRGYDLMQLLMRQSWRKQQPTIRATWRLMGRSYSSRMPRSCTEVRGHIKAPQTLSSPMSRWIHCLRVAHHRKSIFSGLSCWNASIRRSAQHQAPFDAAAVQSSVNGGPKCKAEIHPRYTL